MNRNNGEQSGWWGGYIKLVVLWLSNATRLVFLLSALCVCEVGGGECKVNLLLQEQAVSKDACDAQLLP